MYVTTDCCNVHFFTAILVCIPHWVVTFQAVRSTAHCHSFWAAIPWCQGLTPCGPAPRWLTPGSRGMLCNQEPQENVSASSLCRLSRTRCSIPREGSVNPQLMSLPPTPPSLTWQSRCKNFFWLSDQCIPSRSSCLSVPAGFHAVFHAGSEPRFVRIQRREDSLFALRKCSYECQGSENASHDGRRLGWERWVLGFYGDTQGAFERSAVGFCGTRQ